MIPLKPLPSPTIAVSMPRVQVGNIVHEIGMHERQSSAWSEAKACLSEVRGNIFFNMPRAAINKNDGFGGGTVIAENLLFNTCVLWAARY